MRRVLLENTITLLGPDLLSKEAGLVKEFRALAGRMGIQLGWHYLLDLAWIGRELGDPKGARILDAGAGTGSLQWWLAEKGAQVISVDRQDRSDLSFRFRMAYKVQGLREVDLLTPGQMIARRLQHDPGGIGSRSMAAVRAALGGMLSRTRSKAPGEVIMYNHDLVPLQDLPDEHADAVVSVSALEHNDPENLQPVVDELMRVLKPGGMLLATMAASPDRDWFHAPSQGWCLTSSSLRDAFGLPSRSEDDFTDFASVLEDLRACKELEDGLAPFHFESGENGMPWGKWDPQYVPVGIKVYKA